MAEDFSSKISLHPLDETVCLDGEDVEDLSQFKDYPSSAARETHVFWDVEQYPIPSNANLKSVRSGIISALDQMGFYGCVTINAYGGRMNHSKDDLYYARILHTPQGEGEMAVDLILYAHRRSPRNFMVIPKPDPESELHRVLKCLQTRHHNILLVKSKAPDGLFLSDSVSVQSVVDCTQGLDGGKPIIGGIRMKDTLPVIKDLPSLEFLFHLKLNTQCQGSERKAFVFWDVVKYPFPTRANIIKNVANDIRAALQRLGHHGCVEILAFGGDKLNLNHLKDDLYKEARIICIPQGFFEKALHFFSTSLFHGPLMVIPKPDPDSGLDRVLTWLKERRYDVLSVKPPPPPDDEDSPQDDLFLQYAQLILGCTYGLYEGKPIVRGRRKMKDMHVIQDFSKPITFEKGATAGVFWNLEDFPFPAGWKPDDIYKKIESAFRADGYELGNMLIWAYVDDKEGSWGGEFLKYKTWQSSIYFLPGGGDKSARRNRMLHDINLWERDLQSPYYHFPAYLVLVSDKDKVGEDEEFSCRLRVLTQSDYTVLVVSPTDKAHDCEWLPSPSTYTFGNERRIRTEGGIDRCGLIHSYRY